MNTPAPRLIVHVVYRLAVGGLENGVVNLINRLPADAWSHAIVSLTDVDPEFARRIHRRDVQAVALGKGPGHGFSFYPALYRLFRRARPAIVHTRNLAALEATFPAWLAGVPVRVHGEHGRDVDDLDGSSRKYRWVRRLYRPFVSHYVALSKNLADYLQGPIAVAPERIAQLYNGVDTVQFAPAPEGRAAITGCPFTGSDLWLVGTVGRMREVKDPVTLAEAFVHAVQNHASGKRLRLVMVGDGPLRDRVEFVLGSAGLRDQAWLPGERSDVPEILRGLDCFVLPSLSEGVSNALLEAMATGLPIVATRVGGNPELVEEGVTGRLIPSGDSVAMATAVLAYFDDRATARQHARAARQAAVERFSLDRMVRDYLSLYDGLLRRHDGAPAQTADATQPVSREG